MGRKGGAKDGKISKHLTLHSPLFPSPIPPPPPPLPVFLSSILNIKTEKLLKLKKEFFSQKYRRE